MDEVVRAIQRVTDIMGEISAASVEQNAGMSQISDAVTQMDHTTQQNAALVEESAAAADSLRSQAAGLVQSVAVFRLSEQAQQPAAAEFKAVAHKRTFQPAAAANAGWAGPGTPQRRARAERGPARVQGLLGCPGGSAPGSGQQIGRHRHPRRAVGELLRPHGGAAQIASGSTSSAQRSKPLCSRLRACSSGIQCQSRRCRAPRLPASTSICMRSTLATRATLMGMAG